MITGSYSSLTIEMITGRLYNNRLTMNMRPPERSNRSMRGLRTCLRSLRTSGRSFGGISYEWSEWTEWVIDVRMERYDMRRDHRYRV